MTRRFAHAAAIGAEWPEIAKGCADGLQPLPDGANLGFIYVTEAIADDLESILTFLRQTTGVQDWVGSVGRGICAGSAEIHDQRAAAVMLGAFPADGFAVFPPLRDGPEELPAGTRDWIDKVQPLVSVVHCDPYSDGYMDVVGKLAGDLGSFVIGGVTGARRNFKQVAGDVTHGGVSGVMFAPEVQILTGLSQGCTPMAEPHMISDAADNVIMSIEGETALAVLQRDMGERLSRDLVGQAGNIHAAFPVAESDTRDYMVRTLVGVNMERGWIAVGGEVSPGDRVMFVRRDRESAEKDLVAMVDNLLARLPSEPAGGLYFSCLARGPHLFGEAGNEMAIITDRLGEDVPLVGFFGNGEISNARLYGYTGVLTLFL